jgi:hypothetical protein
MTIPSVPDRLRAPLVVDGRVVCKLMLDLTIYLGVPTPGELDAMLDLALALAPAGSLRKYKIQEHELWFPLERPELTASGRAAAAQGGWMPCFEPTRRRIVEGRSFEAGLWDGREIEDPLGSWSFMCRSILLQESGLHAFARFLVPLATDSVVLRRAAMAVADRIALHSGHGGLVFVYDPRAKEAALDEVYALARRYWGIDIEDLNRTLPLMHDAIKGVNWLTLVGPRFAAQLAVADGLSALPQSGVDVARRRHATVLTAGAEPVAGDRHRPNGGLNQYIAVAKALEPLFPDAVPDFTSQRFVDNGNSTGWVRRFIDPSGWR